MIHKDIMEIVRESQSKIVEAFRSWIESEAERILSVEFSEAEPKHPRPLLADAQVGWVCRLRNGEYVQIDSLSNDRPCPIMCKSDIGGMDCFTLDGRNHNAVGDEKDIVHCEPLAEEGTAEWAWQMWQLG
ncbi:MAG TPA: hypothetical protein PL124_13105, partial [Candidatus Cloacimonadota bacterium]|nr:hypothetical protein [Candidatus Cloacimonadota bacterium]